MRSLKLTGLLLVVVLCGLGMAGLVACGSSEPSESNSPTVPATKTYHSEEHSFSIIYPSHYAMQTSGDATVTESGLVFGVTFSDKEGTAADEQVVEGVQANIYPLPSEVDPEDAEAAQRFYSNGIAHVVAGLDHGRLTEPVEAAEVNGVQGFRFTYCDLRNGTEMCTLAYILLAGGQQYELLAAARADRWDDVSQEMEAALTSFRLD